jgi:nifR3 family TIM-barrel protein
VLQIGSHQFDTTAVLAPMAAVTDLPFRTVCEEHGVGLTITEFLSAEALVRNAQKTLAKLTASLDGRRFGVQIFGREPDSLQRAAEMAVGIGATLVDINMGCPAKRVVAGECGSALMKEPELAAELVRAVKRAVPADVPVTVKHRAGWDDQHRNAPEFACALVEAGAAMITVHGRTRSQGFSGASDLGIIARVRAAVPAHIPVVGNGDVKDLEAYKRMRGETGCDAVMIGRGAMGNPFLFAAIARHERSIEDERPEAPTPAERRQVFDRHVALILRLVPERGHVVELRKACAWYSKGIPGGSVLRQKAWAARHADELLRSAAEFWDHFLTGSHPAREMNPLAEERLDA